MTRAIIFANGNFSDLSPAKKIIKKTDYLIAADGGVNYLKKLKLMPDIVIGDMDSIKSELFKEYKSIKYPTKKDKTDFELTIDYCLEKKFREIIIFGVLGDRIDHLMANIFLLAKIQTENPTIKIKVIEGKKEIFILNKEIVINGKIGDEISIIPVGEKLEDILTDGLEYQLDNESLLFGSTRGISNVMNKKLVKIKASAGIAMIEHNLQ